MKKKAFDLGAVLSVTTGTLLCDIGKVYEILNYLTGDNLFTHQLPRASKVCAPHIFSQVPALKDADTSSVTTENWKTWLDNAKLKYGDVILLEPVPLFGYQKKDPIDEAIEMVGEDKVLLWDPSLQKRPNS